jgi:hypothetical protein
MPFRTPIPRLDPARAYLLAVLPAAVLLVAAAVATWSG